MLERNLNFIISDSEVPGIESVNNDSENKENKEVPGIESVNNDSENKENKEVPEIESVNNDSENKENKSNNNSKKLLKKWYILRAMGGKEQKTLIAIEKEVERLNMTTHVEKLFIPVEKVVKIKNGKKITKDRNYLPGYILVYAHLLGETEASLRNVPGVLGFLKSPATGEPMPMRDSEVDRILGKADELLDGPENIINVFIIGEQVKIIDGPFNSFNGIVDKIDEQKKKLAVSVSIFGRKQPVEVSFIQVEKI